jgi:hypothetical protein
LTKGAFEIALIYQPQAPVIPKLPSSSPRSLVPTRITNYYDAKLATQTTGSH